ncbi:ATP-binding protein [Amycolatopsis sp. WAC 04169]|uniref:ATP-binding protein n=1 Tax=Amycolatopsis sp. WAC 04169 TaxID=2203197 RepID=UPI00131583CF|nr:ATP-binding protein [Amycolatopsis sp. WAC 04169]
MAAAYEMRGNKGLLIGNENVQNNTFEQHVHAPAAITPMEEVNAPVGLINLPERSALFVGREGDLRRLRDAMTAPASGLVVVTAVHGLGGIGKSTLAAHYAETHRGDYTLVWWITADTPTAIETGLARLAIALQPAVQTLPLEQQIEHGLRWLATHHDWLLMLDNLSQPADAAAVLGRIRGGHVLITSRRTTGWHTVATPLAVDALEPDRAAEMLARILANSSTSAQDADMVCAELGHLPLAIEQAGAYMAETHTTPGKYLRLLRQSPAAMYGKTAEGAQAQRTMARIWRITLDRLADAPLVGALLRVLAWYASDNIPAYLLDGLADELAVSEALGRLAAYAMITRSSETISVHRLVQAVTRTPDTDDPHRTPHDINHARNHAAHTLAQALEGLNYEAPQDWSRLRILLPHVEALASHTKPDDDTIDTVVALDGISRFLKAQGAVASVTVYLRRCLSSSQRILGPDHPETLASRNNLASSYQEAGDLDQAISLHQATLADREQVLGPEHPETLASRNNLASAYRAKGDLGRAIPLLESAVADYERVLGFADPGTLASRNNLATAYQAAGDPARAIPLLETTLANYERVLGTEHPGTLASRNNLATAYQEVGNLERAIPLLETTLATRDRVLSPDHPSTLASRNNLAYAYQAAGDLEQAVPLYEATLADRERVSGPDHPDTIASRNNLAYAYRAVGDLEQAVSLYQVSLIDCERVLGPVHPTTLTARNNLAGAYETAGDLGLATKLYKATLADCERVLGPVHPTTLTARNNLAGAYETAGDLGLATKLYKATLVDRERVSGPDHPDTLISRNNLAWAYLASGRSRRAVPLLRATLAACERVLGADHPTTHAVRANLRRASKT